MITKARIAALVATAMIGVPIALISTSHASDHADTPAIAANPGADLTDVFIFPSSDNPDNVVLAMDVHPLIQPGAQGDVSFDPNVLYEFKIDNTGDYQEDLVIQARFTGTGPNQKVWISGPVRPSHPGTMSAQENLYPVTGTINTTFSPAPGVKVFAGAREDPFFFDLEQFFNIFPDRATPLTGQAIANPNQPHALTFRPKGQAVDFLSNGGYNVLSIVVELPRKALLKNTGGSSNGKRNNVIGLWCVTGTPSGDLFKQTDRLARPAINEVFASVADNRHQVNDENSPTMDYVDLKKDMDSFLTFPAGRSPQIRQVIEAVLVPDVLKADLGSHDQASYLGYETGGATGGKFGGRKLSDDVIDISLGAIFGNIIPALGLAPDDGAEIPALTTDNVGAEGKHFTTTFPYIGAPVDVARP